MILYIFYHNWKQLSNFIAFLFNAGVKKNENVNMEQTKNNQQWLAKTKKNLHQFGEYAFWEKLIEIEDCRFRSTCWQ